MPYFTGSSHEQTQRFRLAYITSQDIAHSRFHRYWAYAPIEIKYRSQQVGPITFVPRCLTGGISGTVSVCHFSREDRLTSR